MAKRAFGEGLDGALVAALRLSAMRRFALDVVVTVKGGGLLKGIMTQFQNLEEVKTIDAAGEERTLAYNPDRSIADDEQFRACCFAPFALSLILIQRCRTNGSV